VRYEHVGEHVSATEDEVRRWLFAESRILDEFRLDDWLELLDADVRYWMPVRTIRKLSERELEFGEPGDEVCLLDEDLISLQMRVRKMQHAMSWSDNPSPRVVRMVSNVEVLGEPSTGEYAVRSVLYLQRHRFSRDLDQWLVARYDRLVAHEQGLRLRERRIYSSAPVLMSPNLSVLF